MGRKVPPFAPAGASTETAAAAAEGRKRKGASLAPLTPCKRLAPASGGWASLPTDIVGLVTRRLLAVDGDVVDYIAFRAVCSGWRACTPTPRDPTLRDPCLLPRAWVALCDGDAVRPDDACEIAFFHTRTARRLRVRLPEVRGHRIVCITDGLVILLHKRTTAVRVLHPFTRVVVDLPPIAPVYHKVVRSKRDLLAMNAAVCRHAAVPPLQLPSLSSSGSHGQRQCSPLFQIQVGRSSTEDFKFAAPCPSKEGSTPPSRVPE